jgi:hypothetical protein
LRTRKADVKVENVEPDFRPVVITLETQAEIDVLHALVALAGGNYAEGFTYKLYKELDKRSDSGPIDYWTGALGVKKTW